MPDFFIDDDSATFAPATAQHLASATQQDKDAAQQYVVGQQRSGLASLGAAVGLAGVDLLDTAASSIPGVRSITGMERGQLNNAVLSGIGSPGLMKFYDENKGAIEVGSGIAGIIASDYIAGRILKPGSFAMEAIRAVPYVRRVATLDKQYEQSVRLAQLTNQALAKRGAMGVEQFVGDTVLSRLGATGLATSARESANFLRGTAVAKGLARNATTEGIMALTLNQNSFLYDEDASHNIAWSAAGLGIGAGVDLWRSRYALSRIANSDRSNRLFQAAYDVTGKEDQRLRAALMNYEGEADKSWLGYGQGVISDRVTSMLLTARELGKKTGDSVVSRILGKNRESLQTPQLEMAYEESSKITSRGIPSVPGTGFTYNSPGYGKPLLEAMYHEPATLYGVEHIGGANTDLGIMGTHETRQASLKSRLDDVTRTLSDGGKWRRTSRKVGGESVFHDELIPLSDEAKSALQAEYKQLVFNNSLSAHVMLEPGEWQPIQMGKIIEGFEPAKIVFERTPGEQVGGIWQRVGTEGQPNIGIGHDGELFLPAGKKVDNLDFYDALHLYHAADAMTTHMAQMRQTLQLPSKPNWFQLDTAEVLIRKTNDPTLVQWPAGLTRETAQVESFAQKVDAIRRKEGSKRIAAMRGALPLDEVDAFKMRVQFNLPRLTSYQAGLIGDAEHPIEILLNGAKSGDDIRKLSRAEIQQGINEAAKIKGFTQATPDSADEMLGNTFNFMKDQDGNPMKPIIGYKRPFAPHEWGQDNLAERLAVGKMMTREKLTGEDAGALIRMLTTSVISDPNFTEASRVLGLQDAQIRSAIPGFADAAPQTARSGFLNSFVQKEWRDRDNPVLLAASRVRELQDRLVRDVMRQTIQNEMGDVISRVNGPRSAQSKLLLNQFFTHRSGWELAREPAQITLPNGQPGFAFVLDHESVLNRRRFEQQYGRPLEEGQKLLNPQGQDMVLDQLGMEAVERFNRVAEQIRQEKNTLLRASNLAEIKATPHYTPPPNTKGKYIGFTFDESDNLVPGGTVIASTPEEFARLEAKMRESSVMKPGYTFRTREKVTNFMDLWDKAQMDWMAPGTTAIQPGKKALGGTAGREINPNAFDEAMTWMRDSYLQLGSDAMSQLFKDQINATKARSAVAGLESRTAVGKQDLRGRSIYDFYIENITGRSSLAAPDSFFGEGMNWAERRINAGLREVTPHMSRVYEGLKDWLSNVRPGHDAASGEKFRTLSQNLGPYMPYKSAAEMIERETGAARPTDLAAITGKLSWFEAATRLRWFESMHAVVNLAGIVNAMPAVIRSMQRMPGEADEAYMQRIGHIGQVLDLPDGRQIGLIDTAKIAWRSMKRAWSREAHPYFEYMQGRGLLGQEVAEFHRQFGAIKSRGDLMGFLLGDASKEVDQTAGFLRQKAQAVAKSGGIDHWIGIISDKSEDFSRSWGMMAGLEVAEHLGITGMERKVAFAHDMTNKMIANYEPRNRPEIFQGALGAPIGLFQSYIQNFYQRMFRYIETGNTRALATQYATQGAIFGMASVPGWGAINAAFFDRGNEDTDPIDSVYNRFGQAAGDMLMSGTLSNLPKLVGADGVNLYTRGDTQVRLPGFNPPPMFDTMRRVYQGIGEGLKMFSDENPNVTGQQLAEVASNLLTNRPIAGFIETFGAGGYDTDRYGQVVAESKSLADKVYRVIGVRSMTQQKEIDAFYANKNAQEQQNALKATLREATRASIRAGDFEAIPRLFEKHVEMGGDPRYYTRWIKDAYEAAMATRGERQLDDVLKHPEKMSYINRLLDARVGVEEGDRDTEDYGASARQESEMDTQLDVLPEMPPELTDPTRAAQGANLLENDSVFQSSM